MSKKIFNDLKAGLKEMVAYGQGKLDLQSEEIEIAEQPANYTSKDIKRIRERLNYSQGLFSRALNVSIKTVQSWESGNRVPSHSALRLLELVDMGIYRPDVLKKEQKKLKLRRVTREGI
jgi:putative transcriptional regulator